MTREEIVAKYRARLLLFVTEAWTVRKESQSVLGLVLDNHHRELQQLLGEIWRDFNPAIEPSLPVVQPVTQRPNGPPQTNGTGQRLRQ